VANFTYLVQENRQVKFIDSSTFDTTNGAKPAKWTWDFDTSQEFGCTGDPQNKPKYCNGNKSDDADSTDQNPIYPYTTSGTYQVKLTVEDSDGNVSEPKTALINLIAGMSGGSNGASPTANVLKADLRTDPMFKYETKDARQSKVIHLPANSNGQNITLFWGISTGDIKEYKIDKNTWCDSDGNGGSNGRADDVNNPTLIGATCLRASTGEPADNCWTTNYSRFAKTGNQKGPGNFTTMLSVVDRNGVVATDTVDIVFDGPTDPAKVAKSSCEPKPNMLSGSLFSDLGMQNVLLIGTVGGVILVLLIAGVASFMRKGKEREI
jgi:PKD repeat protein